MKRHEITKEVRQALARWNKVLTQQDMADQLGISRAVLSQWMDGKIKSVRDSNFQVLMDKIHPYMCEREEYEDTSLCDSLVVAIRRIAASEHFTSEQKILIINVISGVK